MNNIKITFPDNSVRSYEAGVTAIDIANSIGPRLAKETIAASINNNLVDAFLPINNDAKIELHTIKSSISHDILLHSTAHLMAQAVKRIWPDCQITIGPVIENRFFYDFDIDVTFSDNDLIKIENEMQKIVEENHNVSRTNLSRNEAIKFFKRIGDNYKVEIINDLDPSENLSSYHQGEFVDLCRGPHVPTTGHIKYFKLLSTSGAYWRGDENNKMLQRIYGTAFFSKKELNKYLNFLEESKKRDHRKLGKELSIFSFDDEVGSGLPLWLPNGGVIINELEKLAKETEDRYGYHQVRSPHITKGDLYKKSGHLDLYKESMFPAMDIDGTEYYLKPMNCPHHHKIYDASPKSYRDLPYRIAEYGTCYRYEKSGQLFGLMRVRSMQMNDAHIYCSEKDFKKEFLDVCKMYLEYFDIFGIEKYQMRLSLHDKANLGKKYINQPDLWIKTEDQVRKALEEGGINFTEIPGEAAFYGPKVDVQVWSAIGKEFTLATNQVDFAIPRKFDLSYTDEHGNYKTPLCIHRAPLSTHERFIGFLIEHFGGDFPLWLAPVQIVLLPISDKYLNYANNLKEKFVDRGFRVKLDDRPDKIGAKIRQSEIDRIPLMVVVGEKEEQDNSLSLRRRFIAKQRTFSVDNFILDIQKEIMNRSLPNRES